jgi:hypothetical protein
VSLGGGRVARSGRNPRPSGAGAIFVQISGTIRDYSHLEDTTERFRSPTKRKRFQQSVVGTIFDTICPSFDAFRCRPRSSDQCKWGRRCVMVMCAVFIRTQGPACPRADTDGILPRNQRCDPRNNSSR